jgi:hypothetical protein
MRRSRFLYLAASLAMAGLLAPQTGLAGQTPTSPAPAAIPMASDLALGQGGLLRGQVVDAQGAPLAGASISVWHDNQQVVRTVADEQGQFVVTGLRGGVHQVVAGEGSAVYRLWTAQTAPPAAAQAAMIVSGNQVVRAQGPGPIIRNVLNSPVLWGAIGYTAGHIIGFNAGLDRTPSSP